MIGVETMQLMCFSLFLFSATFFVSWGARTETGGGVGAPLPPFGKALGKLSSDDLQATVEKGLKLYSKPI